MRKVAAALFACAVAAVSAAGATAVVPPRTASVIASSTAAGAKPVALVYKLTFEMQCGDPGNTPLTLRLPAGMTVPESIPASAVRLNGDPATSVKSSGTSLVVSIEQKTFIKCGVVGMGTLTVVIGKSAGLGNPKAAGVYAFPIAIGAMRGVPKMRIS
jgi:hypothetical protein